MVAVLRVNGITTDPFSVTNGLHQGCTMAPVLFNIYMWAVIFCWKQRIEELNDVGIEFHYKCSNNFYRPSRRSDPTAKNAECQFADDSALVAISCGRAELALQLFADSE